MVDGGISSTAHPRRIDRPSEWLNGSDCADSAGSGS
jgi:hypothetical protein